MPPGMIMDRDTSADAPPAALTYSISAGLLMDTAVAALFMLEMLFDVHHENVAPVKIAFLQGAIQEAARWPDKRTSGMVDRRVARPPA